MSLIRFNSVSLDIGDQRILREADFDIWPGERVCLIGRNGAGKSTTLRLLTKELEPDHGEILRSDGLVVSQLQQAMPDAGRAPVRAVVRSGLADLQAMLDEYRARSQQSTEPDALRELEKLQALIEAHGGWHIDKHVDTTLSELNLPPERTMDELSGGWRRRVALAAALVQKPDLLLLDEPTNHLDLATIGWLEHTLEEYEGAVLFITHDRTFLQRLATRIVELDRGRLTSWPGDYLNYLRRKEEALVAEERDNERLDRRLEQEEAWLRQGVKARRTRNEGRVRALEKMRRDHAERPRREGEPRIVIEEAERSGRVVVRAKNVGYSFGSRPLIDNFSIRILRGDRVGIIGNNGVGKTTLLRLLLGEIEPDSGTVKLGTNLAFGYFDQLRQSLDPNRSVADNVAGGKTHVTFFGKDRHVIGYLKGFLFSPKRAGTLVRSLSGGERNRVILAKLFTKPINVLVLDEPTNDLDLETLEVLEARLVEFGGTVIAVSHDRKFLDNIVTSILVFEEDGLRQYVGGYSDWLRRGHRLAEVDNPRSGRREANRRRVDAGAGGPKKLSYHEQRELDRLPEEIGRLEDRLSRLQRVVSETGFYTRGHEVTRTVLDELKQVQWSLDRAMERWAELEERQQLYLDGRS